MHPCGASLPSHLYESLRRDPGRLVVQYYGLDGAIKSVRAGELMAAASAIAVRLASVNLPPRSLVGIIHNSGFWLHAAWLGAIFANHIPTMIAPPSPRMEPRKFSEGFRGVVGHMGAKAVLLDSETQKKLGELLPADVPVIMTSGIEPVAGMVCDPPPAVDPSAEVLVQHTSGTTGIQKAIGFTSRQIQIHSGAYAHRLELRENDVVVSWLPLYHDMGFIACFVTPLVLGIPIVEMSPFDWVRAPGMLFDAIGKTGATFCWLPNFAFNVLSEERLATTALREAKNWTLGGMRAFISCSEPVSAVSVERFVERLSPFGVRRDQVIASYAMAENLFAVTQNPLSRPAMLWIDRNALESDKRAVRAAANAAGAVALISNGPPLETTSIEVRDDAGNLLSDGSVAHIHIAGDHLFAGYRGREDINARVIDRNGFFDTGDLGFILDGELFVTGRAKDLIIIRGRNYYPQDVEAIVGRIEGVNPGRVVAFGIPDETTGTEKLIVMLETMDGFTGAARDLELAIRREIAQMLDCTPGDVVIVPRRALIKSTSGKLARADNRSRYLEGVKAR